MSFTYPPRKKTPTPLPQSLEQLQDGFAQVDEIPPTPQRYREPGDPDWTLAFERLFAAGHKIAYVPQLPGVQTYDVTRGLHLPNDMSLDMVPGATIKAVAPITGAMLTIGDGTVQRRFGWLKGGTFDCNDLAETGVFVPWQWGLAIEDIVIIDHTGHGLIMGDNTLPGVSAQHKIRGVELWSSPGRTAPVGSYGIWLARASDGTIADTTVQSAETGFRTDSAANRFISCHSWFSGTGFNKVSFDDNGGLNEWMNCSADTPSEYGFILRQYESRIVGGLSVLFTTALNNIPTAIHVPSGAFQGAIISHRVAGSAASKWAADFDGAAPAPALKLLGNSSIHANVSKLNRDSTENFDVFNGLRINTDNSGPTVRGGAADPNGIISGATGDVWFRTNAASTAGARIYCCTGGTTWASVA